MLPFTTCFATFGDLQCSTGGNTNKLVKKKDTWACTPGPWEFGQASRCMCLKRQTKKWEDGDKQSGGKHTIKNHSLGSLPEEKDAIWRRDIKMQPLRSVLNKLCNQLEHWRAHTGVMVPKLEGSMQDWKVGWVAVLSVKETNQAESITRFSRL